MKPQWYIPLLTLLLAAAFFLVRYLSGSNELVANTLMKVFIGALSLVTWIVMGIVLGAGGIGFGVGSAILFNRLGTRHADFKFSTLQHFLTAAVLGIVIGLVYMALLPAVYAIPWRAVPEFFTVFGIDGFTDGTQVIWGGVITLEFWVGYLFAS